MDRFDDVVRGVELETIAVTIVRICLVEDWGTRHPDPPDQDVAHQVIDEVVDDLRVYWGAGGFDDFVVGMVGR